MLRLATALNRYLERNPIGEVFTSVLVQPDLFVAPFVETRTNEWARIQTLLLAVEVLSPSSIRADRDLKRKLYQRFGVKVYWVIDPEHGQVEVWTPGVHFPATEHSRLVWHPEGAVEPFTIGVEDLLATP